MITMGMTILIKTSFGYLVS